MSYRNILLLILSAAISQASLASLKKEIKKDSGVSTIPVIVPYDGKKNNGYQILILSKDQYVKATELTSPDKLENNYFKIVEDEGNESLNVGDFDGDNVLYHLMVARSYYSPLATRSGSPDPALTHKIIIRVRVVNAYNMETHFGKSPGYDDARYIPASADKKWDSEIWFHSRKGKLENMDWGTLSVSSIAAVGLGAAVALPITVPLDILAHYNFGMDSAKMPNAIYHEAFHWASDAKGLFPMAGCGDPMAENYANYFGSSISGEPKLLEIKEFTSKYYQRNYSKLHEVKNTHSQAYNWSAFVPSLFWKVRDILGADRTDQIIWDSLLEMKGLKTDLDIPGAIFAAMAKDPTITAEEQKQIQNLLSQKTTQSLHNLDARFGLLPVD